jgi:hypothetical protein
MNHDDPALWRWYAGAFSKRGGKFTRTETMEGRDGFYLVGTLCDGDARVFIDGRAWREMGDKMVRLGDMLAARLDRYIDLHRQISLQDRRFDVV